MTDRTFLPPERCRSAARRSGDGTDGCVTRRPSYEIDLLVLLAFVTTKGYAERTVLLL